MLQFFSVKPARSLLVPHDTQTVVEILHMRVRAKELKLS